MTLTEKSQGNRTMFYDGDLHVGTIIEQEKGKRSKPGLYQWLTVLSGGHVGTFDEAKEAIRQELELNFHPNAT